MLVIGFTSTLSISISISVITYAVEIRHLYILEHSVDINHKMFSAQCVYLGPNMEAPCEEKLFMEYLSFPLTFVVYDNFELNSRCMSGQTYSAHVL